MRRFVIAVLLAMLMLVLAVSAAFADNPHFISASASVDSSTGVLTATFKEAGLGTTVTTETITLSVSNASAIYVCINGGSKHPSAGNKMTLSTSLTTSGAFPVRNGQTTGSLSVGPVGPMGFTCPSGQTRVLADVSYSGVTLTGVAGDTANIPGTFKACLITNKFPSLGGLCTL